MEKQAYTFTKGDKGKWGKAFEMEIKRVLGKKKWDKVSPQGKPDFKFNKHNYDAKQGGTVLQYTPGAKYVDGCPRVIYATHIAYTLIAETEDTITFTVDLANTDLHCVHRDPFIAFLLENGFCKENKAREQVNIQTMYNYKKAAYHGTIAEPIEAWLYENEEDDDDIISAILAGLDD